VTGDRFGWIGETIDGKYRVESVAGEGGFAVVYRGEHLALRQPIAIKCLKVDELSPADQQHFGQELMQEGRTLHELSRATAGIVQVLDVGSATSPSGALTPYLVLEWLEGRSLQHDISGRRRRGIGGRSLEETVALLEPAAMALAEAHKRRVAHRDLKPSNLYIARITGAQTVKVLDFGISKTISGTLSAMNVHKATNVSLKAFSLPYGAPEQFDPSFRTTGPWTDVFAFALVMVEVMSGERALQGRHAREVMTRCLDREVRPSPRQLGVPVTGAVEHVFQRALTVNPEQRFQTMGEMWGALKAAMNKAPPSVEERRPSMAPATRPRLSELPLPPQGVMLAAAGALVLLGGVGAWALWAHWDANAERAKAAPSPMLAPPSRRELDAAREQVAAANARAWNAEREQSGEAKCTEALLAAAEGRCNDAQRRLRSCVGVHFVRVRSAVQRRCDAGSSGATTDGGEASSRDPCGAAMAAVSAGKCNEARLHLARCKGFRRGSAAANVSARCDSELRR
jgi:serine/threonine-protein kinase